jgi:hypothetical protein
MNYCREVVVVIVWLLDLQMLAQPLKLLVRIPLMSMQCQCDLRGVLATTLCEQVFH